MKIQGTLFLHGYGVRGDIWRLTRAVTESRFGPTSAPDLSAGDISELIALGTEAIRQFSRERHGPVLVVGHSLGAILTAIATQDLEPGTVAAAVMLAPPWGERESVPGGLLRFLLKHRLVPPALIRPRFFSDKTPLAEQKRIFADAVRESPAIQALSFEKTWFHVARLTGPLRVPSMVIASEGDRIVPARQSAAMAAFLGSELVTIPAQESVGHDDLFAAPEVVDLVGSHIDRFLSTAP